MANKAQGTVNGVLEATAPIWPLAWELPYATDEALKKQKKKREKTLKLEILIECGNTTQK